jgi:hypothetical protein
MAEPIFMRVGAGQQTVELPELVGAMGDFLGLLREYDSSVAERNVGSLVWRVTTLTQEPAPLVGVTPFTRKAHPDISERVEQELISNMSALTETGERSKMLSDASIRRVERIARMSPRIGDTAIYTKIKNVPVTTLVTVKTLSQVEELTRVQSTSFGTIRGSLDSISVHKGREFRVWDEQTRRPVRCIFDGKHEGKVKELLGKNVSVTGVVKADRTGRPISMRVEDFDLQFSPNNLPTIAEMRGIIPNFTGGLSLREFFEDFD